MLAAAGFCVALMGQIGFIEQLTPWLKYLVFGGVAIISFMAVSFIVLTRAVQFLIGTAVCVAGIGALLSPLLFFFFK